MEETVKIEVTLGVGMNQLLPETIVIEIQPEQDDESGNSGK